VRQLVVLSETVTILSAVGVFAGIAAAASWLKTKEVETNTDRDIMVLERWN